MIAFSPCSVNSKHLFLLCNAAVALLLNQPVHLPANPHEHVHFMPPNRRFAEETPHRHEKILRIVRAQKINGEQRFAQAGVQKIPLGLSDAP